MEDGVLGATAWARLQPTPSALFARRRRGGTGLTTILINHLDCSLPDHRDTHDKAMDITPTNGKQTKMTTHLTTNEHDSESALPFCHRRELSLRENLNTRRRFHRVIGLLSVCYYYHLGPPRYLRHGISNLFSLFLRPTSKGIIVEVLTNLIFGHAYIFSPGLSFSPSFRRQVRSLPGGCRAGIQT